MDGQHSIDTALSSISSDLECSKRSQLLAFISHLMSESDYRPITINTVLLNRDKLVQILDYPELSEEQVYRLISRSIIQFDETFNYAKKKDYENEEILANNYFATVIASQALIMLREERIKVEEDNPVPYCTDQCRSDLKSVLGLRNDPDEANTKVFCRQIEQLIVSLIYDTEDPIALDCFKRVLFAQETIRSIADKNNVSPYAITQRIRDKAFSVTRRKEMHIAVELFALKFGIEISPFNERAFIGFIRKVFEALPTELIERLKQKIESRIEFLKMG